MKIRLEPNKTSIRLSKSEFEQLVNIGKLGCSTTFPNGETLSISVTLSTEKGLAYNGNHIDIELPTHQIKGHKPNKAGISFYFQLDNENEHLLIFEVDIKKPRLGSSHSLNS